MVGKFILMTLGGLSVSGAAIGGIVLLGQRNETKNLTATEIKAFIKNGTVSGGGKWRITDTAMQQVEIQEDDYADLQKNWEKIVPHMPESFFKKFHGQECSNKSKCFQIWEVSIKQEHKALYIPFQAPSGITKLRILISADENQKRKVNIEFGSDPGKPIDEENMNNTFLSTHTNWMKNTPPTPAPSAESIKAIEEIYKMYLLTIKRLKELGSEQRPISNKPTKVWDW